MFELEENTNIGANIKVVGVGGGGCNAVETMIAGSLEGVEFLVANTDKQCLDANRADKKMHLGVELTKGLGAGANPEVGRRAAIESYNEIVENLEGADMVFVTAGMGGGTGTGAAPIVAKVAKELGALTIGVVTKPFIFEGKKRGRHANEGIRELKENVDSLIVIPNQKLLAISSEKTPLLETFKKADEVLFQAVKGISDLIHKRGLINLDFADIKTVMASQGMAIMGSGSATGENRAVEAATAAISSPLLENIAIDGATGIIINVTGGSDLSLMEVNEASMLVTEAAHEDAEIIFGAVIDNNLEDEIHVTVIATGFGDANQKMVSDQISKLNAIAQAHHQQSVYADTARTLQEPTMYRQPVTQTQAPVQPQAPVQQQQQQPVPTYAAPVVEQAPAAAPVQTQNFHNETVTTDVNPVAPTFPVNHGNTTTETATAAASITPMEETAASQAEEVLPRDMLLAKVRAYRESQSRNAQSTAQPEQLSMNVEEPAAEMQTPSSPFNTADLETPAFMRKRQQEVGPTE